MTEPLVTLPEPPLFRGDPHIEPLPQTPTLLSVLQTAVERHVDADQLEKLAALYMQGERLRAEKEFAAAMHACQQEMPVVVRDAQNKQTQSRYAMLETVQRTTRPIYTKHGFSMSYGEADCPVAGHKRTTCDVTHVGGHTRSYHLDLPLDGIGAKGNPIGGMNPVQAAVSTTSYGQRRLLCMVFNVTVADEDLDGQSQSEPISEEQAVTIREWLVATSTNEKRFLEWAECDSVATFPARKFEAALDFFRRKSGR